MIAVLLTSRWPLIVALIGSWSVSAHAQQAEKSDDDTLVLARVAGENGANPSVTTSDKNKKLQAIVDRVVSRTNAFRKKNELSAVQTEKHLTATAVAFARYMARTGRYGHLADGSRAGERAAEQGYEYCLIAENIAYYFNPDQPEASGYADWFVDGWIESKGHRENMLNEHVTQTGVGVARHDDSGYYFAVQLFGRPQSEHLEFQVVNSAGRSVAYRVLSEGDSRTFNLPARATMTHTRCFAPQIQLDADGAEPTPVEKGARYLIENNGDRLRLTERDQ